MIAVRSRFDASCVALFAIAVVANLARPSPDREIIGCLDLPPSATSPARPAISTTAPAIDEPACDGFEYDFVPYVETPRTDPRRSDRARDTVWGQAPPLPLTKGGGVRHLHFHL